ncbi:hypothetical protein [Vitreimonas sp.]|uniref:hypothetical protein n=1 Tax=Vitreimonas sp. TaxID=3069702 RepID=UPI002ED94450
MKKLGFIAASMGTAVLLAVGAAGVAHMVTHPGEVVVDEANAAEIVPLASPSARPENAPVRVRAAAEADEPRSNWGVLSFAMGDGAREERATSAPAPQQNAAPVTPARSSDDNDDDDDDD